MIGLLVLGLCALASVQGDLPPDYQTWTDVAKQEYLWNLLSQDRTEGTWPWSSIIGLEKFLKSDLSKAFDVTSDYRPYGQRSVHCVGAVAKFLFVPSRNNTMFANYTGIFKTGARGILRLSTASQPSTPGLFSDASLNPAVAMKFLRSGAPSFNTVFMYRMTGHSGLNLFQFPLATQVPESDYNFVLSWAKTIFQKVSPYPGFSGKSNMAIYDRNGTKIPDDQVRYPFGIIIQPNPRATALLDGNEDNDVMGKITELFGNSWNGSPLYRVWGATGPNVPESDKLVLLGYIFIEGEITTSKWGDEHLFFQQERFEEDLVLKPEWKSYVDDPNFLYSEGVPDKYTKYLPAWETPEY